MKEKSDSHLQHVINNEDKFRDLAVEAAKQVLEERENRDSSSEVEQQEENQPRDFSERKPINPKYSLRAIATYQLISALTILPFFVNIPEGMNLRIGLMYSFGLLLYVATLASAILIYNKNQLGLFIGLFTNALQSIQISAGGMVYHATGFMQLFFNVGTFSGFNFGIMGSNFSMNFGVQPDATYIGFNIVAILATYFIYKASTFWDEQGEFPEHLY